MDLSNLKSSLFGYNKLAVSNYVSGLESESNQKVQDLQKAAKETEDTLRSQIEELRTKYEEEVQKLNEKIDALTEERDLLRRDNDTIADTLLDAEEYAADLRCKADQKAKERDEEHVQVLTMQQNKIEEEKAIYVPSEEAAEEEAVEEETEAEEAAEETEEEAAEEKAEEAVQETEEKADEASDEAIEKAADMADALENEAEKSEESTVDQWKKFYGQEQEEAVSKFEQAAGEITGKLQ